MPKPFTTIVPPSFKAASETYQYAPAVRIGDQILISGIIGADAEGRLPPDFRSQAENVFTTLEAILKEAGATLDDVGSLHSYHVGDLHSQLRDLVDIKAKRIRPPHPAWTGVGVTQLGVPGALLEISAVAVARDQDVDTEHTDRGDRQMTEKPRYDAMRMLEGKVAIVTGAGSGIGRAAALRFAREGARVVVADLNAGTARAVVEEIQAAGGTAVAVTGDLSDQAVVDQVVQTAVDTFGGVDVLVNNAAIADRLTAAADVSDAEWDRVIRVNLTAPFLLTRAALPHMLAKGKGAIVNTASRAGLGGSAGGTAYTVSKHGVIGLTRSLAVMYRDAGIRANAIAPGATATNMYRDAPGSTATKIALIAEVDPTARGPRTISPYMSNTGRVADADEQAAVIVFLASDDASNINGAIVPVDNGWSAI